MRYDAMLLMRSTLRSPAREGRKPEAGDGGGVRLCAGRMHLSGKRERLWHGMGLRVMSSRDAFSPNASGPIEPAHSNHLLFVCRPSHNTVMSR
jgi:hypothetical protein